MKRETPLVSLIIPVYNVELYVHKCMESAISQTFRPHEYEIIVVNDASTDKSLEICKTYADKYQNLSIISHDHNKGLGPSRNTGLDHARGDYVFFLDGDDYIAPTTLQKLWMSAIDERADIVLCGYFKVDTEGNLVSRDNSFRNIKYQRTALLNQIFRYELSPMCCSRLFARHLFEDNNIRFPAKLHEDTYVSYKLYFFARKVEKINYHYYNWVQRPMSITSGITAEHINDWMDALIERKQWIFDHYGMHAYHKFNSNLNFGLVKVINNVILPRIQDRNKMSPEELEVILDKLRNMMTNEEYTAGVPFEYFERVRDLLDNKFVAEPIPN